MSMPSDGARFVGALSEGSSPTTSPVSVRFAAAGLELVGIERHARHTWPYAALKASVPVRRDAPDVLLSLKADGAQTLFVADPSFAQVLLASAPGLSRARQRWQGLKPGLGVLGAVALPVGGRWALYVHRSQAVARHLPFEARGKLRQAAGVSGAADRKVRGTLGR